MNTSINRGQLFIASCFALVTTAMAFGLRANMVGAWSSQFGLTIEQVGTINGTAFWGFTLAMIFGGPLVDALGMKRLIWVAFVGHLVGILLTHFATGYMSLFISTLIVGIANGTVEAVCNPLVSSLYTDNKVRMLNRFHVWFPGGIVIGGLLGYFLGEKLGWSWELQILTMLIPNVIYGYLFWGKNLPVTERVASGVTTSEMFTACLTPLFLLMVGCMFITASTELGTGQLISKLLEGQVANPILVLCFINLIMVAGRLGGSFFHKFSPQGVLLFSAVFSTLGLYWMSQATGMTIFAAAAVFAMGVCFFWPTMIGFVAEFLPRTGALGMAIMGGAGMLAVAVVLPVLGGYLDKQSGAETLRAYSVLPLALIFVFAGLYYFTKKK